MPWFQAALRQAAATSEFVRASENHRPLHKDPTFVCSYSRRPQISEKPNVSRSRFDFALEFQTTPMHAEPKGRAQNAA